MKEKQYLCNEDTVLSYENSHYQNFLVLFS